MNNDTYNKGGFIAFVFSIIFSLCFMGYVAFFSGGIDLREIPKAPTEAAPTLAENAAEQTPAVDVSKIEDPWVSSEALIAHGKKVFEMNCAVCHGPKGLGDGPAGQGLNPPPRNFVKGDWKQGGTSIDLFNTLKTGVKGSSMASFAHLPTVDRWSLVHFIRSITHNKIKDDPEKLAEFGKTAE